MLIKKANEMPQFTTDLEEARYKLKYFREKVRNAPTHDAVAKLQYFEERVLKLERATATLQ